VTTVVRDVSKVFPTRVGGTEMVIDDSGVYYRSPTWWSRPGPKASRRDWRDRIRVGDILRGRSGVERVVRSCLYKMDGRLVGVTFTIMRCSQFRACYTLYGRNDLKQAGFRPTGHRKALRGAMDKQIFDNMRLHLRKSQGARRALDCCDVDGIR
jgi:hypothetical protein